MALTCAVKNCSNGAYWLNKWKKELCCECGCLHKEKNCKCCPPFRLFTFPTKKKNPEGRERWKQLIGRRTGNKLWSPTKDTRVCSSHFVGGEPTLQNPMPTLNLGYDGYEARVKRILFFKEEQKVYYKEIPNSEILYTARPVYSDPPLETLEPSSPTIPWFIVLLMILMNLVHQLQQLNSKIVLLVAENLRLRSEIHFLKSKKYVDNILKTDEDVNFFTGLKNKSVFKKMHDVIAPLVNRRWLGVKTTSSNVRKFLKEPSRFGPKRKLSSQAEFLLTLMRLRLGLLGNDLAQRFDISESLCARIFLTWLRACSSVFGAMVYIPDEETLIATKPNKFRDIQDLHSIIDCTEIFIETPKDLHLQSATWSDYKHHNTMKLLVSCTPNSSIVYVSPAYTGRISDKALTVECGYLDTIPPYSMIMADKGFNIEEECAARNLTLYVPPGRRGKSQMSQAAVRKTKKIANSRIIIEQVIRRLKTFKIIQNELPISLIPHVDDIVSTCSGISNTREPIYK